MVERPVTNLSVSYVPESLPGLCSIGEPINVALLVLGEAVLSAHCQKEPKKDLLPM